MQTQELEINPFEIEDSLHCLESGLIQVDFVRLTIEERVTQAVDGYYTGNRMISASVIKGNVGKAVLGKSILLIKGEGLSELLYLETVNGNPQVNTRCYGLGRALVTKTIKEAKKKGNRLMTLTSVKTAEDFYEKVFKKEKQRGRIRDYNKIGQNFNIYL